MSRLRRAALAGCTLVVLAGCSLAESAPKRDAGTPPASATASTPAASASATASASVANTPPRPPPPKGWGDETKWSGTIEEQNELLLEELRYFHQLDDATMSRLKEIFTASKVMAQGNPKPTKHPMSPAACEQKLETEGVSYHNREFERICGGKWEAPLYDPETQKPSDATTCIDQFEFPNIPCRYPVTWARARDAVLVCQAQGKRMCDAHEWEGACYGKLEPHQYNFGLAKKMKQDEAFRAMRKQHNYRIEEKDQRWAFGPEFKKGICATGSKKSKKCNPGGWKTCGSNTYPSGAFPKCANPLQVFDIHGNAAEHMNLPVLPEQMATSETQEYGHTEMKGSWFVWDRTRAHKDWCQWRAPYWHGGRVMSKSSHRNYHLGFRCCRSLKGNTETGADKDAGDKKATDEAAPKD